MISGTGYFIRSSQGKRTRSVQPPSKAETNITDAKEDNSYQEKQSYQQEVNITYSFTGIHLMIKICIMTFHLKFPNVIGFLIFLMGFYNIFIRRLAVGSGGVSEAPSPASKAGKLAQAASSSHKVTSLLLNILGFLLFVSSKIVFPSHRSPSISPSVGPRGNQRESC